MRAHLQLTSLLLLVGSLFAQNAPALQPDILPQATPGAWQPSSPQAEAEAFEVDPDFRIDLVASEPQVKQPLVLTFDELGRMYVCEAPATASRDDAPRGRITCFVDSQGDGTYKPAEVFLEGLVQPRAVACWDGGLLVLDADELLSARDTDGDGRADRVFPLVVGFGGVQSGVLPAPLCWGLDNRLYGQTGTCKTTLQRADVPDAPQLSLLDHGFAFDPCSHALTSYAGYGPRGMTFDASGRVFVASDAQPIQIVADDTLQQETDNGSVVPSCCASIAVESPEIPVFSTAPPSSATLHPTGLVLCEGNSWPAAYLGNLLVLDTGNHLIHRRILNANGLIPTSHRADQDSEFLRSHDPAFQPVFAQFGPDGCLYLVDRYAPDIASNTACGRIWRIAPRSHQPTKQPLPRDTSADERVAMLAHPDPWHRETAARLIAASQDRAPRTALETLARQGAPAEGRIRALYALSRLGILSDNLLALALSDGAPEVRLQALRITAPRLATDMRHTSRVLALTGDADPRVRFEAVRTLSKVWCADRAEPLAQAFRRDGADPWFREALLRAAREVAQPVLQELLSEPAYPAAPESAPALQALARLALLQPGHMDAAFPLAVLNSLPADAGATRKLLASGFVAGAVDARRWNILTRLVQAPGPAGETLANLLVEARAAAIDATAPTEERLHAIGLLSTSQFASAGSLLSNLLTPTESFKIQAAAVRSLGMLGDPGAVPLMLAAWPTLSPKVRLLAMNAIKQDAVLTLALLDAAESGAISTDSLVRWGLSDLARHANSMIRNHAVALLAARAPQSSDAIDRTFQNIRQLKASIPNGKALFEANCTKCHHYDGLGSKVGPDLDFMAHSGAYPLLRNILAPNLDVNPAYYGYNVETNDFQTMAGIISRDDAKSIGVLAGGGQEQDVIRDNISSIQSTERTLMPEDWGTVLGDQGLADLIGYLVDAARKPAKRAVP